MVPEWTLQDRLRKAREVAGFDQPRLADAIGVSTRTVSNAERGAVQVRRITINAWALATGVPVDWLLVGHQGLEPRTRWLRVAARRQVARFTPDDAA